MILVPIKNVKALTYAMYHIIPLVERVIHLLLIYASLIYYLDYTFDLTNRVDIDRSVGPTIFCNLVQIHTFLSIDYIWIFIINPMNICINSAIKIIIYSYDPDKI